MTMTTQKEGATGVASADTPSIPSCAGDSRRDGTGVSDRLPVVRSGPKKFNGRGRKRSKRREHAERPDVVGSELQPVFGPKPDLLTVAYQSMITDALYNINDSSSIFRGDKAQVRMVGRCKNRLPQSNRLSVVPYEQVPDFLKVALSFPCPEGMIFTMIAAVGGGIAFLSPHTVCAACGNAFCLGFHDAPIQEVVLSVEYCCPEDDIADDVSTRSGHVLAEPAQQSPQLPSPPSVDAPAALAADAIPPPVETGELLPELAVGPPSLSSSDDDEIEHPLDLFYDCTAIFREQLDQLEKLFDAEHESIFEQCNQECALLDVRERTERETAARCAVFCRPVDYDWGDEELAEDFDRMDFIFHRYQLFGPAPKPLALRAPFLSISFGSRCAWMCALLGVTVRLLQAFSHFADVKIEDLTDNDVQRNLHRARRYVERHSGTFSSSLVSLVSKSDIGSRLTSLTISQMDNLLRALRRANLEVTHVLFRPVEKPSGFGFEDLGLHLLPNHVDLIVARNSPAYFLATRIQPFLFQAWGIVDINMDFQIMPIQFLFKTIRMTDFGRTRHFHSFHLDACPFRKWVLENRTGVNILRPTSYLKFLFGRRTPDCTCNEGFAFEEPLMMSHCDEAVMPDCLEKLMQLEPVVRITEQTCMSVAQTFAAKYQPSVVKRVLLVDEPTANAYSREVVAFLSTQRGLSVLGKRLLARSAQLDHRPSVVRAPVKKNCGQMLEVSFPLEFLAPFSGKKRMVAQTRRCEMCGADNGCCCITCPECGNRVPSGGFCETCERATHCYAGHLLFRPDVGVHTTGSLREQQCPKCSTRPSDGFEAAGISSILDCISELHFVPRLIDEVCHVPPFVTSATRYEKFPVDMEHDRRCKVYDVNAWRDMERQPGAYAFGLIFNGNVPTVAHMDGYTAYAAVLSRQCAIRPEPEVDAVAAMRRLIEDTVEYFDYYSISGGVIEPEEFAQWISRFPAAKVHRYEPANELYEYGYPMGEELQKRKCFLKHETTSWPDGTDTASKAARLITCFSGRPKNYIPCVVLGRYTHPMAAIMKNAWNGKQSYQAGGRLLYYAAGSTGLQIGKWFDTWKSSFGYFVHADYSKYDSSISRALLELEQMFYRILGLHESTSPMLRDALRVLEWQLNPVADVTIQNRKVCSFKSEGRRSSGDMNTTLGNTILNGYALVSSLMRCLGMRFSAIEENFRIAVCGDDVLILSRLHPNVWKDKLVKEHVKLGFTLEAEYAANATSIRFVGSFPLSVVVDGRQCTVFVPALERWLPKIGWTANRYLDHPSFVRGIALGWGHLKCLPIYGTVLKTYLRMSDPVSRLGDLVKPIIPDSQMTFFGAENPTLIPNDATYQDLWTAYALTGEDIADFDEICCTKVRSLPCIVSFEPIRRIISGDVVY